MKKYRVVGQRSRTESESGWKEKDVLLTDTQNVHTLEKRGGRWYFKSTDNPVARESELEFALYHQNPRR